MKELKDILYRVSLKGINGSTAMPVHGISFDSRRVQQGFVFVAVVGTAFDGHAFIPQAIEAGATAVVCQQMPNNLQANITYVQVENSAKALGYIAANFHDNPSTKLKLVGITGTNGKTTTATLLYRLFMGLGYATGLLSTVVNYVNGTEVAATHTTPDPLQLNALLDQMVQAGCTHVFMEVSSHALVQERVAGITFAGGVFTNISHDHLDYHGTFDAYIKAKKRLFDMLPSSAFALINTDDKRGKIMMQNTLANVQSFALRTVANFKAKVLSNTLQGLELDIDGHNMWCKLVGQFNAYNLLAAYGTAILLQQNEADVLTVLSEVRPAPGRMQQVFANEQSPTAPGQQAITALVDYAHTPDALENVLTTIAAFRTGNEQLITVVGCGGDRDREKRPKMAAIAVKYSDKVVFTADNPRSEDPNDIIKDMQEGVSATHYKKTLVVPNREEAIKTACTLAAPGDIILVAGKGHETYQEIKGVRRHFDDREVLAQMLNLTQ